MNWNQTGMPTSLVSQLGQRRELAEFKSVLGDAQNRIMRPVDVEQMAQELQKSGGREFVEMVKELTTALANTRKELEDANQRYERLTSDLKRRGVCIAEDSPSPPPADDSREAVSEAVPSGSSKSQADGLAEWEEWDRRFRSLLG